MDSLKYPKLYEKTSNVRKTYGCADFRTIENCNNSAWILENINILHPGDVATLVEYNREPSVRSLLIQKLHMYYIVSRQ